MNVVEILKSLLNIKSKNLQSNQLTKQQLFDFCLLLSCAFGYTMPRRDESKLQLSEYAQLLTFQSNKRHFNWIHPHVDSGNLLKAYLELYDKVNVRNNNNNYIICDNIMYNPLVFIGEYNLSSGQHSIQIQFTNEDRDLLNNHNNIISAYIYTIDDNIPNSNIVKTYCNGLTIQFNGFRSQTKVQPYTFNVPQDNYFPINILQIQLQHFNNAKIQLYIAHKLSIEQLEQSLLKKPMITSKRYLEILKMQSDFVNKYNIVIINTNVDEQDEDDDIQETNEIINLRSPLTLGQIKVPVKGYNCRHFTESNDLKEIVDQIESQGFTSCPICQQKYKLDQIYIDAFFYYLIRLMKCKDKVEIKNNKIQFQQDNNSHNSPANSDEESGW